MKTVPSHLLADAKHGGYHHASIALCLLSLFIAVTATDPGPFALLLAAGGIYLVLFSILLQALFGLRKPLSSCFAA